MEIVYRTSLGIYPFNHPKDTNSTYVEHLVSNSTLPLTQSLKQTLRIYKNVQCPHLIPLLKFMKDQDQVHFFYHYYPTNLHGFLSDKSKTVLLRLREELACALQCLQNQGLKAEANIQNIAVDSQGALKLFITPQNLSRATNLDDFYVTERTRLLMQLSEVWELYNIKNTGQSKHEHPGFRISGNGLIFTEDDKGKRNGRKSEEHSLLTEEKGHGLQSEGKEHNLHSEGKEHKNEDKKQAGHSHSARMILAEIEKQKEKAKKWKEKQSQLKSQGENLAQSQTVKRQKLLKKLSINSEIQTQSHKSYIKKQSQTKLTNSTADSPNATPKNYCSSLRTEKQPENPQSPLSYEDVRVIAIKRLQDQGKEMKQQPKIQVTTEMVSKYKMKIVTCQEIEFQGKQGDNIQKIAHQKLLEYQQQYNLTALSFEGASHHCSDETNTKTSNDKSGSFEEGQDQKQRSKMEGGQEEIIAKIMKAKEKAENVMKEYARTKKK